MTDDIPSPIRPVGDQRGSHGFIEVAQGHILAEDHNSFERNQREG
jgi:glutathione transport system ATP-binding protein